LRVVPTRRSRAPRGPFALLVVLLLGGGLISLLLLNTTLGRNSYVVYRLTRSTEQLGETEQQLREELDRRQAPAALAQQAAALGMVPATSPAFVRLSDGAILGKAEPGQRPPTPVQPQPRGLPAVAAATAAPSARATATPTAGRGRDRAHRGSDLATRSAVPPRGPATPDPLAPSSEPTSG
jgi:hypothetical protein